MVVIGGFDPLPVQRQYTDMLRRKGKAVQVAEFSDAFHGFYSFLELADANKVLQDMKAFVESNMAASKPRGDDGGDRLVLAVTRSAVRLAATTALAVFRNGEGTSAIARKSGTRWHDQFGRNSKIGDRFEQITLAVKERVARPPGLGDDDNFGNGVGDLGDGKGEGKLGIKWGCLARSLGTTEAARAQGAVSRGAQGRWRRCELRGGGRSSVSSRGSLWWNSGEVRRRRG
uniref:PH01B001I13.10 protein n=1 Tax=Phyllostachys edulis TaxID=38705 RepID=L0P1L3_PHYED|nr:PH01B001I13.10 [Phyllostachys edulis]